MTSHAKRREDLHSLLAAEGTCNARETAYLYSQPARKKGWPCIANKLCKDPLTWGLSLANRFEGRVQLQNFAAKDLLATATWACRSVRLSPIPNPLLPLLPAIALPANLVSFS